MSEFAAAAAALTPVPAPRWSGWRRTVRSEYEAGLVPVEFAGALDLGRVMTWLRQRLPDDAIVTSDAFYRISSSETAALGSNKESAQ